MNKCLSGSFSGIKSIQKWSAYLPLFVGLFTTTTFTLSFPPFDSSQLIFICFVPLSLWAMIGPQKRYLITCFLSGFASWSILLSWFRHIGDFMEGWILSGYIAILLIASIISLLFTIWCYFLRKILLSVKNKNTWTRFTGIFAIAGLWVILEWARTFLIFGFPWLPLAASQWKNPLMLQPAAWLGCYGISFMIIIINLGLFFYLKHLFGSKKKGKIPFIKKLCPEFYLALSCVGGSFYLFTKELPGNQPKDLLFNACIVQPATPQSVKWDPNEALNNWFHLEYLTKKAIRENPHSNLLLWPESATPTPLLGDDELKLVVEKLVQELSVPLISGNMAIEDESDRIFNAVFVIDPDSGVQDLFYKKRKLVPFGEYVPMKWFPFVNKIFNTGWDFTAGNQASVLKVQLKESKGEEGTIKYPAYFSNVGPLVCYEDTFPGLSRDLVKNKADFLFVTTNNGWFGKEGAAFQHAAHSVLRAVENRRPVIRCGNAGWSGWIDEYGFIRDTFEKEGTIYEDGFKCFAVTRYIKFIDHTTFYTANGDCFVLLCLFFFIRALRFKSKKVTQLKNTP